MGAHAGGPGVGYQMTFANITAGGGHTAPGGGLVGIFSGFPFTSANTLAVAGSGGGGGQNVGGPGGAYAVPAGSSSWCAIRIVDMSVAQCN